MKHDFYASNPASEWVSCGDIEKKLSVIADPGVFVAPCSREVLVFAATYFVSSSEKEQVFSMLSIAKELNKDTAKESVLAIDTE